MVGGACVNCHGLQGAADGSGAFPRLDGQHAWYLYKQLRDYASGERAHAVMTPIARVLTDRQMQDVAAWYAAQAEIVEGPSGEFDLRVRQLGGSIAATGAPDRGVIACAQCHGMQGEGAGPAIPTLVGQYAPYTALQLHLWKRGERRNGPLGVMAQVAAGMTDEEIEAVAAYYAALAPAPR
nr:c-type cytochrome [Falsiroseomonas tokyonensis]